MGLVIFSPFFRRSVTSLWNAKVLSWCAVVGSPSMTDGLMVTLTLRRLPFTVLV
jgi:hypothetical protein